MKPLCFVLMPFGRKPVGPLSVDFDAVYETLIAPAIEQAGMTALRADEERAGGIIHTQMFERLLLCEYAVADLTGANANVFYELGVRHAARPRSTVLIFADKVLLPFDLGPVRALPYAMGDDGLPRRIEADRARIADHLEEAQRTRQDSPLFELLKGYPKIDPAAAGAFQSRVFDTGRVKEKLHNARAGGAAAIGAVERELGPLGRLDGGLVVDLLLAYRSVAGADAREGYEHMVRIVEAMPPYLASSQMAQEQKAFALNRLGRRPEAKRVLEELIRQRGATSETCGLLGRVLKDEWKELKAAGRRLPAEAMLDEAIAVYTKGFEADWRDAYPGVNVATLMEVREPPDPERARLLPVVRYAVQRRLAAATADYWDHASMLEVCVLENDRSGAAASLGRACNRVVERFQPETTAGNLRLIREARERRCEDAAWIAEIEQELLVHAQAAPPPA